MGYQKYAVGSIILIGSSPLFLYIGILGFIHSLYFRGAFVVFMAIFNFCWGGYLIKSAYQAWKYTPKTHRRDKPEKPEIIYKSGKHHFK